MFNRVYFEISGICNAKCYFCQTGQSNMNKIPTGRFVNIEEFEKSMMYLREHGFINGEAVISLYNWGEPFLHPKIKDIILFLHNNNFHTSLSTNASKPVFFEKGNILKNLTNVTFSMPGFSQSSYDKIHGFNFIKIKKNIVDITKNFREAGFTGQFLIAGHIYQFNMHEILPMQDFAKEHGIQFLPSLAFINDFKRLRKYIQKELEYDYLDQASKALFLFYMEQIKKTPDNYKCPQYSFLSIDSDCNVITCCGDSTVLDKVYKLKPNQINDWRSNGVCRECYSSGLCYLAGEVVPSVIRPQQIISFK